jgi:signal transduction histidine kinase/HAMP domain-containing protein/ActR/RegA family two-component response regulator
MILHSGLEQRQLVATQAKEEALRLARFISNDHTLLIEGTEHFLFVLAQLSPVQNCEPASCASLFAGLLKKYPWFLNIGAADPGGNIFASAVPMPRPINIADRSYFRLALETRRFAIGDYQIGRIVGKPVINFGYPVFDDAHQVKAIVFVAMDLSWLNNLSAGANLPPGSSTTVVDHNGMILAHHPEPEKWVGKNVRGLPIIKTILSQREGMIEAKGIDGEQRLYSFTPFGGMRQEGNLYVGVGIPKAVAFARVDQILNQNLIALALISILALLAVWVGGDLLILRRLRPLVKTAKQLANGDLSARTKIGKGEGELNQLASAFDEMADSLELREAERNRAEESRRKSEEAARRLAQENALVAEVGRIIGSTPNIDEVFDRFSKAVEKLIPFDRIQINLNNPQRDASLVRYVAGIGVPNRRAGEYVALASTASGECTRRKSPLLVQPRNGKEIEEVVGRFPGLLPNFKAGIRSIIMVPLIAEDQAIGVLTLRSTKTEAYADQDVRLTESIASQIAGAVASAQLYVERAQAVEGARKSEEETRRLAEENAIVAEIGRIISSTLSIEEVYERFTEEMRKLIPVDRTAFTIINLEDRTATTVYESGIKIPSRHPGEVFPLSGSATEKAEQARSGLIIKTEDENEVASWVPGLLPVFRTGIRSVMMIPLISRDRVIGVLNLQSSMPNSYTEKELRIAERVGTQIAGAIANAHLFKERLRAEKEMADLQEQLRQSQKMEAVGRLAGGIAHDFNNFLTVMKARSQLALLGLKERDPLKESFEAIDNAATKSANLVRQLLAFSRRQVMEMIVLDLNTLLRDLEKMLRRLIGEDIELFMVLAEDLGRVKADPGQIEQVVLNLAVNARDAMLQGGKLTIETANVELDEAYARSHVATKPGRYGMLSVSDTGVGMTQEVKKQVFEPFFTTKEKGKGTGLGLATAYGIVKQSGGNIWVYSEPGQGATFKIYLPRVDQPLAKEMKKAESGVFRGAGVILVVEDEEGVRNAVLEMLKKQGYSVLGADNAGEALLICQQYKDTIHLLLTDVVMPKVSGPELAKRLGAFHPEMKVLYMSGYTSNAIVHHGVLDREVNYIQKPFTFEGLARKVWEVLDGKTSRS